jgi:iron complex transport system substrate-binding protein
MNKKILAVSVVAILVIAGLGTWFLWFNQNDGDSTGDDGMDNGLLVGNELNDATFPSDFSRLWVYGNANEDDYINEDDVEYLEDIIEGDEDITVLADSNCDGEIDDDDVEYLKDIINENDMKIYYVDNYDKVAVVSWPVNSIATGYCSGAQAVEIAGATDKIDIADNYITKYYAAFNSSYSSLPSYGEPDDPNYEALIETGIDVYLIGYFNSGTDELLEQNLNPIGIDVMFLTCCDQAGVEQPNEDMDRTMMMIAFLIQGDMGKAYDYLAWHDNIVSKVTDAAATISEADQTTFLMSRTSPNDKTSDISITGYNNINNIHAEIAGAYSIGMHDSGLTSMYQTISVEYIIGLGSDVYCDNTHAGFRYGAGSDASARLATFLTQDSNRFDGTTYDPKLIAMAREAGNGPMYVLELVFYQDILYPDLENHLDSYEVLFDYFIDHFTSLDSSNVDVDGFFQVY